MRLANAVLKRAGFEIRRRTPEAPKTSIDELILRVRPYTMTSEERLLALMDSVKYISKNKIPGDIVECGVWKGGSMMLACLVLLQASDSARKVYLYDTFEGMSPPTTRDVCHTGRLAQHMLDESPMGEGIWCYASLEEVKKNLTSTGYPPENIRFVPGKVEETLPGALPDQIALLRLDTDWYESTKHELNHLYPRLAKNGVLILDDYGHWQGAKEATDEYFSSLDHSPLLHRIDYTGRIAVKTT